MMKVSAEVFRLQVLVNGRPVQEYRGPGGDTFVEGRRGSNFELELTNLTTQRILVHPTVDGLSVMTGTTASKNDSAHGYVLSALQTMRVPGWRLDNEEVAQFFFAGNGGSYAEKKGQGENKGVIACTVWNEKIDYIIMPTSSYTTYFPRNMPIRHSCGGGRFTCSNTINVNCCNDVGDAGEELTSGQFNLGTGFGHKTAHQTFSTTFNAESRPICTAIIYYDDRKGLEARGIRLSKKKNATKLPNPFPKDAMGCEPPEDWNG